MRRGEIKYTPDQTKKISCTCGNSEYRRKQDTKNSIRFRINKSGQYICRDCLKVDKVEISESEVCAQSH